MRKTMRRTAALVGSAMLASAGAFAAIPGVAAAEETPCPADAVAESGEATVAEGSGAKAATVGGAFSFTQDRVTDGSVLSGMFAKAANALCQTLPRYCVSCGGLIQVTGPNGAAFSAAANDLAGDDGAAGGIMACACASNVAGGGAVANADVTGASIATIAALAAAL